MHNAIDYTPAAQATELPHEFGWAQWHYWSRVADAGAANDPLINAWLDTQPLGGST